MNEQYELYNNENNEGNTWNYNLKYKDTTKSAIMKMSREFGFGNYTYDETDIKILVKADGHIDSSTVFGRAHTVEKHVYEEVYDTKRYVGQRILKTADTFTKELNVFVIRDLDTRELHFYCVMCKNDTRVNINRKKSRCTFEKADISILGEQLENFREYMNHIGLDYGRVEIVLDRNLGWCVIDINNSPGGGPITEMSYNDLSEIFLRMIESKET